MIISCDAKALEWYVAVELSQDPKGKEELLSGMDVHEINREALKLPTRLFAKIFLFRTIFRGSGWAFANDPDFMHVSSSAAFWDERNSAFYEKYKGLNNQHSIWANEVVQGRSIKGPLGGSWPIVFDGEKIPWTTLSNYPVNCSSLIQ